MQGLKAPLASVLGGLSDLIQWKNMPPLLASCGKTIDWRLLSSGERTQGVFRAALLFGCPREEQGRVGCASERGPCNGNTRTSAAGMIIGPLGRADGGFALLTASWGGVKFNEPKPRTRRFKAPERLYQK